MRCLCCLRKIDKYSTYLRPNGDILCKICYEKYELDRPYSDEDYNRAKQLGFDLDNWKDYCNFYELGDD